MNSADRTIAIQRLTALWAFGECGLGGVMHALKIPFTGLLIGSVAIVCITMIGVYANRDLKQILRSLLIVLIVKAVVSPHTPFPAYIAVSFQAFLGYMLFRLASVNFFTVMMLSIFAMVESAIQKLLLLTFFFGKSFWVSMDEFLTFITKPFGLAASNGSWWIIAAYLTIYVAGGLYTGVIAFRLSRSVFVQKNISLDTELPRPPAKKKRSLYSSLAILVLFSIILLLPSFADQSIAKVLRSIVWTLSAIAIWYFLISPFLTRLIRRYLQKQPGDLQVQATEVIAFIPVLKQLTFASWRSSKTLPPMRRIPGFMTSLFSVVITYRSADKEPV